MGSGFESLAPHVDLPSLTWPWAFRCPRYCRRRAAGLATARRTCIHPGRVPHPRARRKANTSAAVASSVLRSRLAGPVASKPRVHQCWPQVRTSVSSTSHRGWPSPGARGTIRPLASEPADAPPLAYRPPAGRVGAVLAERAAGKGPLLPGLQAAAGPARHLQDSRAAAVCLHLQCPAPADLHRQPVQLRIQQVGVLAGLHLGREPPEPSGHRGLQRPGKIHRTSRLRTPSVTRLTGGTAVIAFCSCTGRAASTLHCRTTALAGAAGTLQALFRGEPS